MGHRVLIQTLYSAGPSHWLHSHLALLRYEIAITLPSFTHCQSRMTSQQPETCWEKLKLQWEKKWKTAEHYYSDELKWYSSSVSLQEESACIQHPPHTVLLNGHQFSEGQYPAVNCQDAHLSNTILFFFFPFACTGINVTCCRNILQWMIMLPPPVFGWYTDRDLQLGEFKSESYTDVSVLSILAHSGRRVWSMKRSGEY